MTADYKLAIMHRAKPLQESPGETRIPRVKGLWQGWQAGRLGILCGPSNESHG